MKQLGLLGFVTCENRQCKELNGTFAATNRCHCCATSQ